MGINFNKFDLQILHSVAMPKVYPRIDRLQMEGQC